MSLSDELKAKAKNGLVSEDVDIEFNISAGVATEATAEETTEEGASEE